ncbi:hypothetical protein [Silvimonas iriomotensis]|uniref:Lactate dehydrogenase n=1 Tax=Silvimonas iriomotensis TaxID=449662 RepID=A0ABQ2P475_9NEIS|nr:hypothetical protein [Silvimonas iriomotensis]GGP17704.1 hypothetical protein GCM10010970_01060 [Silvimonas iriomotensis]
MTVIAPVSVSLLPDQTALASTVRTDGQAAQTPSSAPSVVVNLGAANSQSETSARVYSAQGLLADTAQLQWRSTVQDPVSVMMGKQFQANTLSARFSGLGAALLEKFSSGNGNYSQSVQRTGGSPSLTASLHGDVSLRIKTRSGTLVTLSITSMTSGMDIKVHSDASLTDEERGAIAGLADSFQSAIDGLTQEPPRLDLAGLAGFDTRQLSSVDLDASLNNQSVVPTSASVHLDKQVSSVNVSMTQGKMQLSVNAGNPALQGTAGQRAAAVANLMAQLDAAAKRGQGNATLVSLFKDAFTTFNSKASALDTAGLNLPLNDREHAMLTGLADYTGSITDTPTHPNPLRPGEVDKFEWNVSQSTVFKGKTADDHSITQTQKMTLVAAFHRPLKPGQELRLTTDPDSQNYYYDVINDSAQSRADVAMQDGQLTSATLNQSANQNLHEIKVEKNQITKDQTVPTHQSRVLDLLNLLNQSPLDGTPDQNKHLGDTDPNLRKVHNLVLLTSVLSDADAA